MDSTFVSALGALIEVALVNLVLDNAVVGLAACFAILVLAVAWRIGLHTRQEPG